MMLSPSAAHLGSTTILPARRWRGPREDEWTRMQACGGPPGRRGRGARNERDILNKDRKSTQNTQGPVARIGRLFFIKARSRNGDWDSGGGSWFLLRCPRKAGNRHYSRTGSPPGPCSRLVFFSFFALTPSFLLHTTKSKMKRWRSVCVSTRR